MGIHWQELVIILVLVLVLFGPRRLPEIGRALGSGIREFKDGMTNAVNGTSSSPAKAGGTATTGGDTEPTVVAAEVVDPAKLTAPGA